MPADLVTLSDRTRIGRTRRASLCVALGSPAVLGGGWHTELGVLDAYRRRVTAIGCCRPGIAGIVIGPPVAGPGQACQTARTAGASAAAWARPALAAAARRDTSSTLRPMARTAARSGRTSTTRAPAAVSAAA